MHAADAADAARSRVRTVPQPWGTRVELCAPQVRNALDPDAVAALLDIFTRDEPGPVLLCAEGPAFCAGGDLAVLADAAASGGLADLLVSRAAAFLDVIEAVLGCPRPVVAALDGPAVGGGVSLALACDVRLASPRARLVLGWGSWGLPPDGGAGVLLAAAVGPAAARALLVEAGVLGADSSLAPLLFSRIVPADRLETEALATVTALAAAPGARAAKAAATGSLLAAVRAGREEELAALARAAAEPSVVERLALLYKIER